MSYLKDKPKGCRLDNGDWTRYQVAARRGCLFFTYGASPFALFNRWWQGRRVGKSWRECPSHVGIIGGMRGAYESLPLRGPTRDFSLDRYTIGKRQRMQIASVDAAFGERDIDRAFSALSYYMTRMKRRGYDYLSLIFYGRIQSNSKVICSELATYYLNELTRHDTANRLSTDEFVLPVDLLDRVTIEWEG